MHHGRRGRYRARLRAVTQSQPPFFVQSIFGILGGIGAEPQNLMFMKETADRLLGNDYRWSVLAAGR
ncbi:MAG TPA: 3-keto-5-aminohexanoate cleavage protein, partial [Roseiarcus sp.]|nr:3-keto-5-aminohexanoate cleavage protein [Roseiarcus sp.]